MPLHSSCCPQGHVMEYPVILFERRAGDSLAARLRKKYQCQSYICTKVTRADGIPVWRVTTNPKGE